MNERSDAGTDGIESWHAHVYFDGATAQTARAVYDGVSAAFPGAEIGRFHEKPVGPHPMWSFQIAFGPDLLATLLPWLTLNREGLDVFIHPNTGDGLVDHRDHTVFIGKSYSLNLSIFD